MCHKNVIREKKTVYISLSGLATSGVNLVMVVKISPKNCQTIVLASEVPGTKIHHQKKSRKNKLRSYLQ